MKTFTVVAAVTIMLTFICLQENSAVPLTEEHELVEVMTDDSPAVADQEIPEESWKMPYDIRQKREAAGCRFCCNCCPDMVGCGVCCSF